MDRNYNFLGIQFQYTLVVFQLGAAGLVGPWVSTHSWPNWIMGPPKCYMYRVGWHNFEWDPQLDWIHKKMEKKFLKIGKNCDLRAYHSRSYKDPMGMQLCLQLGPIAIFLTQVVSSQRGPYSGPHKGGHCKHICIWPHWRWVHFLISKFYDYFKQIQLAYV